MAFFRKHVLPRVLQTLTSTRTRDLRRALAERQRRWRSEPHRIRYFHQVDDPYSQLAAQTLSELVRRYDVQIEPFLVGPPPDDAAPERERLEAYSRRDAADVAPGFGLAFPRDAEAPDPPAIELATRILAARVTSGDFVERADRVGEALWSRGVAGLEALTRSLAPADPGAARAALERGNALRQRLGHYLGAMFYYAPEWYWGVDRLWHIERRLQALGALRKGADPSPIAPRPDHAGRSVTPAGRERLQLEYFFSLRSPYTSIAMERVLALPDRLPVEIVLRPVMPMVMRGLPVPRSKSTYIVLDTKREALDAGVSFGRIADPVGKPVERAFSLYPFAREHGRAAQFLHAFTRAAFAKGVDTSDERGLRRVVEAAGLSWAEARPRVGREDWREELEANRKLLFSLGLWGVPSFRLLARPNRQTESDYATWGQDRLWRIEEEILRRVTSGN